MKARLFLHNGTLKFWNVRSKKLMIFVATDLVIHRLILEISNLNFKTQTEHFGA